MKEMSITRKVLLGSFGLLFLIFLLTSGKLFENVDNSEIVVIQSAFSGKMNVYTTPGPVGQWYGTATHYKKSDQFWFSKHNDEGDTSDQSIKIRFNDGGHATLSGSIRYYMPTDIKGILKVHTDFRSQPSIESQLVRQVVTKAVYMTGPLMSSKESSAEKRNDLLAFIEDQAMNGVYKTHQEEVKVHDELTNTDKTQMLVKIVEVKGEPARQETSPAKSYNIVLSGLAINSIDYDSDVERQIKEQQNATMMIQTAIANSRKAEQDAITTELQGKANAAKAKWEQEVKKAQAVTEAQQAKEVATLEAQTAIFEAQKIKTAADAKAYENAKLVMAGLTPQQKMEYEMKTKIGIAEQLSKIQLPSTYMVGSGGNQGNASMLESILGVKLLEEKRSEK